LLHHCPAERGKMGRADAVIDVQSVRIGSNHADTGTQLAEHSRRHLVGGAVGTIHDDLQALEAGTGGHTALAELDVTPGGILLTRHLAQRSEEHTSEL